MAAGIFNKEMEAIRQLMAKSSDLLPINSILLTCTPSQTLLFSDSDKNIAKAMEAADRHRLYPPKSTFSRSSGHKARRGGKVTLKPDQSPEPKKSGNDKGCPFRHQKRGGRQGSK
jgi:hypothetical protein